MCMLQQGRQGIDGMDHPVPYVRPRGEAEAGWHRVCSALAVVHDS